MSRRPSVPWSELAIPAVTLGVVALIGSSVAVGLQQDFITALVSATIVIALFAFVGNSGIISFGHISFVAVGAFAAGVMTIPSAVKPTVLPQLFPFLQQHDVGNLASLGLAVVVGALWAAAFALPIVRLSGLAASIATFAVLEITHNVLRFWDKIGPGGNTLALVPQTTGISQALLGALVALVIGFLYQRSRSARLLRAAREDPVAAASSGVRIQRERFVALVVSGGLAGLAGGLLVHQLGSVNTEQVYLDLTFLTLAMLVIGGTYSLGGAVLGAVGVSLLSSFLGRAENGVAIFGIFDLTLPQGSAQVLLGVLMFIALVVRPRGIGGTSGELGRKLTHLLPGYRSEPVQTEVEHG